MTAGSADRNPNPERRLLLTDACNATTMACCILASLPAFGADRASYFAAPGSGQRVSEYQVELSVKRDQRQVFGIPADCDTLLDSATNGQSFRGTIVDRRLWRKVENDCRYHRFLHRHPQQDLTDHVSGFDFMNASLDDLHIGQPCTDSTTGRRECDWMGDPVSPGRQSTDALAHDATQSCCRLRDGVFHGHFYATPAGIRCQVGAQQPSLRLVAVDFADINGDRVLDAVLRFVPIGPGAVRAPFVLSLTREKSDMPFRRLGDDQTRVE